MLRRVSLRACCALVGLWAPIDASFAANKTWTNAVSGDFGVAVNWTGGVPGAGDTATFNAAGTYTVTFDTVLFPPLPNPVLNQDLFFQGGNVVLTSGAGGPWTYRLTGAGGDDALITGGRLALSNTGGNPLVMIVDDDLRIRGGAIMTVSGGSDVATTDLFLGDSVAPAGDGALLIDGSTSSLTVNGAAQIGVGGQTGALTVRNNALADFNGTLSVASGTATASNDGQISVESGGDIRAANVNIATNSVDGQTGTIDVGNGVGSSTFVQDANTSLVVGAAPSPAKTNSGTLNVNAGGRFTSGTGSGTITVNPTGTIDVDGQFVANGLMTIDGGELLVGATGDFVLALGNTLIVQTNGTATFERDYSTASSATYNITGNGSLWEFLGAGSTLDISNNAQVNISGGGDLTIEDDMSVGNGSNGTLSVQGAGSSVEGTSGNSVFVGHATTGTALVNIGTTASGASLTSSSNFTVDATGTVNVGSVATTGTLDVDGNLHVLGGDVLFGAGGTFDLAHGKTVNVSAGGLVDFVNSYTTTTSGFYNVSDALSKLTTSGPDTTFTVADGTEINVTLGGELSAEGAFIVGDGVEGTVNVDGSDSKLTALGEDNSVFAANGGTASAAFSGSAVISLEGGLEMAVSNVAGTTATVDVLSGADVLLHDKLSLATSGGETTLAVLNIQGADSRVRLLNNAKLAVGHSLTGTATINVGTTESGAILTTSGGEAEIDPTGVINVGSGANTGTINVNGDLDIDGGQLNVAAGSSFVVDDGVTLSVLNGGAFSFGGTPHITSTDTVYNVTGDGSLFEAAGALRLGSGAELNVTLGGDVTTGDNFQMGFTGDSTLLVDGPGSSFTAAGFTASLGANGHMSSIVFSNQAVGSFPTLAMSVSAAGATTVGFEVLSGADVSTTLGLRVGAISAASGATATFNVQGAGSTMTVQLAGLDAVTIGNNTSGAGALNVGTTESGGTFTSAGRVEVQSTGTVIIGGVTTTGTFDVASEVEIDGGTVQLVDGVVRADTITLTGGGTFDFDGGTLHVSTFNGDLVNEGGTLAPGESPGITTVTGSYAQQADGTLEIEIGGPVAGDDYDRLTVNSILALDGTLKVLMIDEFMPGDDDTFDILNWTTLSGEFDDLDLPTVPGFTWDISDLYVTGELRAVELDLLGDYNEDGRVDAGDYVRWRNQLGDELPLPNDDTWGVGLDDYARWKSQYGEPSGPGGGGLANSVPEPATLVILAIGLAIIHGHRRSSRSAS